MSEGRKEGKRKERRKEGTNELEKNAILACEDGDLITVRMGADRWKTIKTHHHHYQIFLKKN